MMSWINGIGGVFVFSQDPKRLAHWYWEHLGLEFAGDGTGGTFYQVFESLDPDHPQVKLDTTFAIMKLNIPGPARPARPEPDAMYGDQPYMVNLRVTDLDGLLARLEAAHIPILSRQDEPYGRFAWLRDLDGNRLELYQPLG